MVAENEGKWLPILVCIYLRICSVIRIQSFECVECSPHLLSIYLYIIVCFSAQIIFIVNFRFQLVFLQLFHHSSYLFHI